MPLANRAVETGSPSSAVSSRPCQKNVIGSLEVREVFKVSSIGTIAGSYVTEGSFERGKQVRLLRDGVVIYEGRLSSLRRFKDDVKEVSKGYDCGMQIKNYNDIQVEDVIEAFQEVEVKKKLK